MHTAPASVPPVDASAASPAIPQAILSGAFRNPLHLLWVWIIPQLCLLVMNLRSFGMIWSEMNEAQRGTGRWMLGAELTMLAAIGGFAYVMHRGRKPVIWAMNWPLLAVAVAYLWFAFSATTSMIPQSVATWILPPGNFLYYQFAFVMPAAFFAALQLACFQSNRRVGHDVGLSLAVMIGLPMLAGLLVQVIGSLPFLERLPWTLFAALFVAATIMVLGALLRLMTQAYTAMRRKGPAPLAILTAVIALAAPIGGLWLNHEIPFPADFQSFGVYGLAALNGLILLLPNFRSLRLHRAVWLAQCALYPFTLYFFIVFLPFLPLSLVATIMAGAGFLILAPIALFALHSQRIYDGFRNEIRDGRAIIPALLGLMAITAIPVTYTAQALYDRQILHRAMDHVYSPDYRASGFHGSPQAIGRALTSLRDFKAGIQLPFLSDFYNWLVFDSLVLPDEKMARLHQIFLGRDLPEATRRAAENAFFGGNTSRRRRGIFQEAGGQPRAFPDAVRLEQLTQLTEPEDASTERTRFTLTLKNTASEEGEFATALQVPEGVLVSGFWLHIGPERVPGRIFEKKTALWVYQKIRDVTRRDPGILLYTGPETLELRVFPFAAGETRTVELELLRPAGGAASVKIGKETRSLGEASASASIALAAAEGDGAAVVIAPGALESMPAIARRPYLHFIVDRS
ncbi:MAG TPA: MSEP-CTERM sorting domain-containing protein, partial [Chthoniobacteraceae bacterium]